MQDDKNKFMPRAPKLWTNISTALLIFFMLAIVYSVVTDSAKGKGQVPLSVVASDIAAGKVKSISISGDDLDVVYKQNDEIKVSKKEEGVALTETLKNYGITSEAISKISIEVKSPSGFAYWFINLAPFV